MNAERVREIEQWKTNKSDFPLITLKWAQSMDGQLADDNDCSQWISGPEERTYTHWLRSMHEGVLVGAGTFLKDCCKLTVRDIPFTGKQPIRIIADPKGRILEALSSNPKLFSSDPSAALRHTYVLSQQTDEMLAAHNTKDVTFLSCPKEETLEHWLYASILQLKAAFPAKEKRPLKSIMVEGGPLILSAFLRGEIADFVEISLSPLLLGGKKHRITPDLRMTDNRRLEPISIQRLGLDTLLRYQISKK